MRRILKGRRPSPALVISAVALSLALVGTAIAGQVNLNTGKIKAESIGGGKLKDDTVKGGKIKESTLGTVPDASALDGLDSTAFLRNYSTVDNETGVNDNQFKSVKATCPAGKTAIAAAYSAYSTGLGGLLHRAHVNGSFQTDGGNSWTVTAVEQDAPDVSWNLTVTAICANVG